MVHRGTFEIAETLNNFTLFVRSRVATAHGHHCCRSTWCHLHINLVQSTIVHANKQIYDIRFQTWDDHLSLWVAHTHVVLNYFRAFRSVD